MFDSLDLLNMLSLVLGARSIEIADLLSKILYTQWEKELYLKGRVDTLWLLIAIKSNSAKPSGSQIQRRARKPRVYGAICFWQFTLAYQTIYKRPISVECLGYSNIQTFNYLLKIIDRQNETRLNSSPGSSQYNGISQSSFPAWQE